MRLAPAFLALSIAANVVALAACWLHPSVAPPLLGGPPITRTPSPGAALGSPAPKVAPRSNEIWSKLESEDLRTLVARLRAAGFSASLTRAIVQARVDERLNAQLRPLVAQAAEAPFWKPRPSDPMWGDAAFREALHQAYRERARLLREVLGDDFFLQAGGEPSALPRRQFGALSAGKIELLQRIAADYDELAAQIRNATQGIALPEDRAKLALLEREKRADLAAVLNREELADYELRSSRVTSRLRAALTVMDASEAEFRAIHDAHRKHDDFLNPLGGRPTGLLTAEYLQQRDAAHRRIADELKAALGEQRQAEFARAANREFQDLIRFAARENLPRENVVRAFDLREQVARESTRIFDDASLTVEQRRSALQQLAETTKARLNAALGPSVATAHLQSSHWFSTVERGGAVVFGPDGNLRSSRSLPLPGN